MRQDKNMTCVDGQRRALVTRSSRSRERGSSLVEASLVALLVLIPLLLGAINFGRGYYYGVEVTNAAKAGAQFGATSTGLLNAAGLTGMVTAAQKEAMDISTSCGGSHNACWASGYPQAQWGCECSGTSTAGGGTNSCGLSQSACTHLVDFVVVTTKATYTPMFSMGGLFPPITLNGQAKIRLAVQ